MNQLKLLVLSDPHGQDHRHGVAVTLVIIAVSVDQVFLFKLYGYEDVSGSGNRKDQMRDRHRRRGPEREEPAKVKRVPHVPVQNRRAESQLCVLLATQVQINLAQAEKIEVVDQKRTDQNQQKPGCE